MRVVHRLDHDEMQVVVVRPLIDAVSLLGRWSDTEQEKKALLLLFLHDVAKGKSTAERDFIELRFGVQLRRGTGGEG